MSKERLLDIAAYLSLLMLVIEVLWPKLVKVVAMIGHDAGRALDWFLARAR